MSNKSSYAALANVYIGQVIILFSYGYSYHLFATGIPQFEPLSSSDGIEVLVDEHSTTGVFS